LVNARVTNSYWIQLYQVITSEIWWYKTVTGPVPIGNWIEQIQL